MEVFPDVRGLVLESMNKYMLLMTVVKAYEGIGISIGVGAGVVLESVTVLVLVSVTVCVLSQKRGQRVQKSR